MTSKRLEQLRQQANFATYVVPPDGPLAPEAHAGDDILELCATIDDLIKQRDRALAAFAKAAGPTKGAKRRAGL